MKKSATKLILLWAIVTSFCMCSIVFVAYYSGNYNASIQFSVIPILFGGLVMLVRAYRNKAGGVSSQFADIFKIGMLMILVCSFIFFISFFLFLYANPVITNRLAEFALSAKLPLNDPPADDTESKSKLLSLFFNPVSFGIVKFIATVFEGAILTLIISAMFSKKQHIAGK
ncbi:MAG: DUF4199 family protein [Bacteroidia bacterium]|nr:DUF4199 family protein [Bacteroidia bacterium]